MLLYSIFTHSMYSKLVNILYGNILYVVHVLYSNKLYALYSYAYILMRITNIIASILIVAM
jgi:hypothetical protein